jgi:hypothetical protein
MLIKGKFGEIGVMNILLTHVFQIHYISQGLNMNVNLLCMYEYQEYKYING